jgi:hypothetical protein
VGIGPAAEEDPAEDAKIVGGNLQVTADGELVGMQAGQASSTIGSRVVCKANLSSRTLV